uniref:Heat repeat protein n=1 Tax=Mycena chlorophos TaxID=658473 RepID=A0ABQ0M367_MYCCL|nr:heat repeat protein [Mycena chlorophos]
MAASRLTPASVPSTLNLLTDLLDVLRDAGHPLEDKLLSYVIYPIRVILSRNDSSEIPNQLLEKIFLILALLCEDLWWTCEIELWEQIFILCGSVIGGIEGKGKAKAREDETKEAAARCLFALLRMRGDADVVPPGGKSAASRIAEFTENASSQRFIPFLGRTLDAILSTADSQHRPLQLVSLDLICVLLDVYFPDELTPTVLPGVVSSMTKLALGKGGNVGWAKGAVVGQALKVLQIVVTRSIGDDVCIRDGAVQHVQDLEDLVELLNPSAPQPNATKPRPYFTSRTPSWLRGTASQLHIALNTLTPLVSHTNPTALLALASLSSHILANTALTLARSQPLLLSFLLSISVSDAPGVGEEARSELHQGEPHIAPSAAFVAGGFQGRASCGYYQRDVPARIAFRAQGWYFCDIGWSGDVVGSDGRHREVGLAIIVGPRAGRAVDGRLWDFYSAAHARERRRGGERSQLS